MNRKMILPVLKTALKENFSLDELQELRKMLNIGSLLDVFEDAVQETIESIVADRFQSPTAE